MKVGIYGQFYHTNAGTYIAQLLELLKRKNINVIIEKDFLELIHLNKTINEDYSYFSTFEELDNSFDLFFCIGGDGTILKSINYIRNLDIPIVGINTGRLGFLATIQKEEIKDSLETILQKDYSISSRSVLNISTNPPSHDPVFKNIALNEIAVSRKNTTSMITVDTWLNDQYLNSYWADGLIVSTPTGSTGYSLSCGGPVITPDAASIIITPIAPHNLNARPLVIKDDTKITLRVSGREDSHLVSMDSRIATLENDTEIIIQKAPYAINLVELNEDSFLQTLRKKLMWGEDKRN
ncbi:NAD kinase [Salegentibacter mishustinae]|jgi:NAD+ kinase|uniref:NAD kinase n=1 Tax=Salegentibacter mishustinae TaxID=270918 RepID=A0A0Q9Z6Q7_9FLAO|nr:NAD kinase [Salegentibacter mishustinae]KRG27561.1 NAD kinase [Salegentibacter mishustinae]MDX1426659.1 NAD kinase [Salegentibacter mishustinae]PNW20382.1 NAD kinase [Salegentibacter mishustinae]PZX63174.1 NAD+ kinase [Salegentibacter mishustinae]GGW92317.1 NAD kinase [Salegentibacter mishustinae]|tara:strand:+ start:318 stop:1202 length:885 start_codon:yes stop_codon:yes gene_type:complete